MTWVKICGITNLEDALTAVEAGADALGFVFYERSPRCIDPETAKKIAAKLPKSVEKVGVFVHGSNPQMEQVAAHVGLTAVQIHVSSLQERVSEQKLSSQLKRYLVLPAKLFFDEKSEGIQWFLPQGKRIDAIFLDSGTERQPGGTGEVFDWEKAARMVGFIGQISPIVVAGGLTPTNVNFAIRTLHPWGVDVSSGTEASLGKKDPQKVRAFIEAVRKNGNNN
jgi:phosphoribosylanthranilate isomerase